MALTVLQQNNKQTPSQWAIKGTHQLYPEAPIENAMTAKISIQMMTAARSHISTTTTTEVPMVRQCHQVRQVKVNNGARMFIKVPTYRRRWPRGIESPPTYSSDQRWLSTSSRVPFHRRLNGFQWPYVSFREIKPVTVIVVVLPGWSFPRIYRWGVRWRTRTYLWPSSQLSRGYSARTRWCYKTQRKILHVSYWLIFGDIFCQIS